MRNKPLEAVQGRAFLMMERKAEWVEGALWQRGVKNEVWCLLGIRTGFR